MRRVLVLGGLGQLGTEITAALREKFGNENVILSDIGKKTDYKNKEKATESGPYYQLDVQNAKKIYEIAKKENVNTIFNLAALLSGTCEQKPQLAWNVNMGGLYNSLEVARQLKCQVFWCSSIAAFGKNIRKNHVPQDVILQPIGMYGVTKVAGELLCNYYFNKFGVDTRSIRFPGIIDKQELPGGGTTDYANEMLQGAVKSKSYSCFLEADTELPMMYIKDAIEGVVQLLEADPSKLRHRNAFNIQAFALTPRQLEAEIKKLIPDFKLSYKINPVKQKIAESWPSSLEDYAARCEWGFSPKYDLPRMVEELIQILTEFYGKKE